MNRLLIICLVGLVAPLATQAASRDVSRPAKTLTTKKAARPLVAGGPIEPMKAPEERSGVGWSGFYFGLNAGAAASEANR
jgi:hypothetical protein